MLTVTLRNLERDGLVTQTMRPTITPKVEYELSERRQSLAAPLRALWFWVRDNRTDIERSRKDFELRVVN
jgi:DNA-binding HxlR family transcriptional regulator